MHSACYSHPLLHLWLLVFVGMTKGLDIASMSVNGSSAAGNCGVTSATGYLMCIGPTSNVLSNCYTNMGATTTAAVTDTNVSSNSPAPVNCNSTGIIAGMIVMAIIFLVCLWRKQQKQGKARLDSTRTTAGNGFWLSTLPNNTCKVDQKTATSPSGYKAEYAMWQISFFLLCSVLRSTSAQVFPSSFTLGVALAPVNGSSATGHCSWTSAAILSEKFPKCNNPNSSVLFDGNIPTLTGLDGDMWASQLLTLQTTGSPLDIILDFSGTPGFTRVRRVEVVMFNCPEWGIGTQVIRVRAGNVGQAAPGVIEDYSITDTSCDSLVRLCLPVSTTLPVITLQFFSPPGSNWVHLAEMKFIGDVNTAPTCPRSPIITMPTDTPPTTVVTSLDDVLTSTPNIDTTSDITISSPAPANSSPTGITTTVISTTFPTPPSSPTGTDTTTASNIPTPGNISSSPTGITTSLDHDVTSTPNTDTTSADTTISSPAPANSSTSPAGIIAGVIVVVILIAVAIVVVIVILVCLRRKQQKQGKARLDSTQTTAGNGLGLGTLQKETDIELTGQGAIVTSRYEKTGQVTQEDTYDVLREHDRQGTMDSGAQQTYSRLDVPNRPRVASEASDPMYSTVAAKPGRERTATSPTDVYAVVDKKKKQPKPPKPYQTDLYAVVSKPAAPPVSIKSPALTDYLESKSVPEDSPDGESSPKTATLTRSMDTEPERTSEDVIMRHTDQ